MGRRDFVVLWFQTLLLALFPWLRTEKGVTVAGRIAEEIVPLRMPNSPDIWTLSDMQAGTLGEIQMDMLVNAYIRAQPEPFWPEPF